MLARTWSTARCLILEEVSTAAPPLHDMILYRSFHGRREQWQVHESECDKLQDAFERMPTVIQLGDFLQLKPTGSSVSFITDPKSFEDTDRG